MYLKVPSAFLPLSRRLATSDLVGGAGAADGNKCTTQRIQRSGISTEKAPERRTAVGVPLRLHSVPSRVLKTGFDH